MFWLTVLCIVFGAGSAAFWCVEAAPWIRQVQKIPSTTILDRCMYLFRFIGKLPVAIPVIVDLTATILLASSFSLGGVIGTMIGLAISDVISVAIIILSKNSKREEAYA